MQVQLIIPLAFILFLLGCQNKPSQNENIEAMEVPEIAEQEESAEEKVSLTFQDFLAMVEKKGTSIPKDLSNKFLDGDNYLSQEILLADGPYRAVLVSNEYLSVSYKVFTYSYDGQLIDSKVLLNSEGGELYDYSVSDSDMNDPRRFKLEGILNLGLYDESIDGPMTDDFKEELLTLGNIEEYYRVGPKGKILVDHFSKVSRLISKFEFEKAEKYIEKNNIDLNAYDVEGERLLPHAVRKFCNPEIIEFLIDQGANPDLPRSMLQIPEYAGLSRPIDFDASKGDLQEFRKQGYVTDISPTRLSLSCEEDAAFQTLVKAGASDTTALLHGAVQWQDTTLLKKLTGGPVKLTEVPRTNNRMILEMLLPITDGLAFGEIIYGEGGDMFESELMTTVRDANTSLVWFMLESGADPNGCLPDTQKPLGEGNYRAITALSIAKDLYNQNMELSQKRENKNEFIERASQYNEIVDLLKKAEAREIEKCQGP